jgi:hypothetical protein
MLSGAGIGRKAVAAASTLSESTLKDIRTGKRLKVSASTQTLILGVGLDAARKGAQVDASKAWAQIDELLDEGFNRASLALRLGMKTPKLQFRRSRMTQANVDRVNALYYLIMASGSLVGTGKSGPAKRRAYNFQDFYVQNSKICNYLR